MRKLFAVLLAMLSWLALGPIFKPVQFFISFLPLKEGTNAYFNTAFLIGALLIVLLYFLWLGFLRWIDKKNG